MKAKLAIGGLLAAFVALAHYTWIGPVDGPFEVGKTAKIQISHGHKFPASEEAINASQVEAFVVTPSGGRVKLDVAAGPNSVGASYAVKEAGLHRIAFVQDRGVNSRTPKGLRPGGRDKNPDATQASRALRTSVAYVATGGSLVSKAKPVGLEIELTAELVGGAWHVQLLKQGKPASGVALDVFLAGAAKVEPVGSTGADGKVIYRPAGGSKGPAMFTAEVRETPPAGAKYDYTSYGTSLYVNW